MIEGSDANPRIVRGGDESIAGSETGADDAQPVIALRFQPVEATAGIDHALAHRVDGAANVGGDGVVGAVIPAGRRMS